MADKDEALHYLLNKLKSDDGWSGSNLAWNVDKLSVIADMFRALDGAAKVKVLVSFMSMTPRTVSQCSTEMNQVLRLARRDGDEWVRLFASLLGPFPDFQRVSSDLVTEEQMEGLAEELEGALNHDSANIFIPHEYAYLNQTVLASSHGYNPPSDHTHFLLKKKPQASVQLRNEILQRAGTDFSQTGSLVKDRHLLQRQMSSSLNSSTAFVPTVRSHSSRKAIPIPTNRVQRERGTKLLNIDEVPVSIRRKRKTITAEDGAPSTASRPDTKKHLRIPSKSEADTTAIPQTTQLPTSPQITATPDYAAGLGSEFTASSMYSQHKYPSAVEAVTTPTYTGQISPPPIQSPEALITPVPLPEAPPTPGPSTSAPPPTQPVAPTTPLPAAAVAKQPNKGLKLSRHQLLVAQEMFKESPTLTKAQKTLILGFMAGARDNPNPDQPVVTIKLNERQEIEEVSGPEGGVVKRIVYETVFEMNYSNGQWRKLQIKRAYPVQQPASVL